MKMCAPSPQQDLLPMELPASTSLPGGSRAKTLALLESSAAWAKAPVPGSGPKSSDLLASYDPITSSWKTSQLCLLAQANGEVDGLAEFSEAWPNAGMMRNGETYRLSWSVPSTAESAFGLLPTPSKSDPILERRAAAATNAHITKNGTVRNGPSNLGLPGMVRLWPTPRNCTAMAATITPESAWDAGRFPNLETMVGWSLWPTPQASDVRDRGNLSSPAIARRKAKGKQIMLSQSVSDTSGALNPTWVEWLQGFPLGWTEED